MDDLDAQLFNDSLDRCLNQPGFIERFYQHFMASSPEVAALFAKTDFRRQTRMLKMSLNMIMVASAGVPEATVHLERIAERHSRRDPNIPPQLYGLWMDSLALAIREFDRCFDEKIELAWRAVLRPGIEFMKSRY